MHGMLTWHVGSIDPAVRGRISQRKEAKSGLTAHAYLLSFVIVEGRCGFIRTLSAE